MKLFKKMLSLAAALAVAAAALPFSGLSAFAAAEGISEIALNEEKIVNVDKDNSGSVMYFFTPTEDGTYAFCSYGGMSVKGKIVDLSENTFMNSPKRRNYGDLYIQYEMKAGSKYLLSAEPIWEYDRASYCLKVTKLTSAQDFHLQTDSIVGIVGDTVEIPAFFEPEMPEEMPVIENIVWTTSDNGIVSVTTNYSETPDISGAFTLNSVGTATVTATTVSGFTDSVQVTVRESEQIHLGDEKNLSADDELSGTGMYSFVPEEEGLYAFYSYNNENDCPTYGAVYDSEMNMLYDNRCAKNQDFYVYSRLTAGETYYFKCEYDVDWANGSYSVKLDRAVPAESVTLFTDNTEAYVNTFSYVTLSYSPENAIPEDVNWSITDSSVAQIQWYNDTKRGLDFISEGTVTVTATTENGLSDSITFTVSEPPEIALDVNNTVEITEAYSSKLFKFVPSETACYFFATDNNYVDFMLTENDGATYNYHNSFSKTLTAGVTYYLYAGYINDYKGTYTFTVTKPNQITSIEIISLPEKLDYYAFEEFDYYGLKLKLTDENGRVYYWSGWNDDIGEFTPEVYRVFDENGNYQYSEISCGSAKARITFNIMENPVRSIVITKAPEREYFYGDYCFGYPSEDGYYLYPDISGIEFTVEYTDGTSVQYGDDAFDKGDLDYEYFNLYVQNDVVVVGQNTVVFSYMNAETTFEVTVKEDTVESISMIKAPDNTECFEYFAPDLTGAEFEITFNDGTTVKKETVAVTSENQGYDSYWSDVAILIPANSSYITVSLEYDDKNNPYYTAAFLSKSCQLNCFTFTDSKPIEFIGVDNFNTDLENMTVNVTYQDMTTESFPVDVIEFYGEENFKQVFCRSDKGVFSLIYDTKYDQNGCKQGYNVNLFGRDIFIPNPFGDINGDGVSDIRDLVRLKKILAKLTQDGKDKADLDKDGSIDAVDAAEFRKYLLSNLSSSGTTETPSEGSGETEAPVSGIAETEASTSG